MPNNFQEAHSSMLYIPEMVDVRDVEYLRRVISEPEKALTEQRGGMLDISSEQLNAAIQHVGLPVKLWEDSYGPEGRKIYRFRTAGRYYEITSKDGKVTLSKPEE